MEKVWSKTLKRLLFGLKKQLSKDMNLLNIIWAFVMKMAMVSNKILPMLIFGTANPLNKVVPPANI